MSFTDNFGNPKGLIGRMMLVTMDREHLPMAEWALEQLEIPQAFVTLRLAKKDNLYLVIGRK